MFLDKKPAFVAEKNLMALKIPPPLMAKVMKDFHFFLNLPLPLLKQGFQVDVNEPR